MMDEIDSGNICNAHLWTVWGYPLDPDWDGESFDIGYTTEGGCGTMIATDLRRDDAEFIVAMARASCATSPKP